MKLLMTDVKEEVLVEQAQQGDLEAYAELVKRYRERIYRTIYRYTRNHNDTDDLAQETFLQAFRAIKSFRKKSGFYTWIFRIAVNRSLNFVKKAGREKEKAGCEEKMENIAATFLHSPEPVSMAKELGERLNEAVDSLPLAYKSSFILVVLQGMTHSQAAQVLRCPENTVSWRLHKARKILQAKLSPYLER
ncbi:MAG: sigma-70 family RNA polymerase sigma factor [Clostridiales bacterium]|nr:sigma-70 family RNA polymerase sigma factor [Clostridiales bacterium]